MVPVFEPTFKLRGKGRRPGLKKPNKQVTLYLDTEEWETIEFYKKLTGMTAGQILKCSAVIGCLPFGPAYQLALLDYRPNNPDKNFLDFLTSISQKASRDFGEVMMGILDDKIDKRKELMKGGSDG